MINVLEDYISRSIPECGDFSTNPALRKKVDEKGAFLPFFGNTVVFDLEDDTKMALQSLQQELYHTAGWMLAQKLDPATFHMTLHDLVNGPVCSEEMRQRMAAAEDGAKILLRQWRDQPPLRMKTTWLFNMVNTSIVLGLAPEDADTRNRLDGMYMALENVVPLGYGLTPHITMAYYRPGRYFSYERNILRQALRPVELNVVLRPEDLIFCNFRDMNTYTQEALPEDITKQE